MTTLLIDADGVAFKAASAVQTNISWDDDIYTSHADIKRAQEVFENELDKIIRGINLGIRGRPHLVMCFSCTSRHYFRHDHLPSYKGHRKSQPPLVLRELKLTIEDAYKTITRPNLEADDVLGILMTNSKLIPDKHRIIVSGDKDLDQIVGDHFNPLSMRRYEVLKPSAERWLWMQVLMGDSTDGYSGCPGVGAVKASRTLEAGPDIPYWQLARAEFHKAGLTDDDFVTQVNVARIIQSNCYDYQDRKPIPWELPTSETSSTTVKTSTAPTRKSPASRKPSKEPTKTRPTGQSSTTPKRKA